MRYRMLFGVAVLAMVAAPPAATAQTGGAGKPVLRHANVEVIPAPESRSTAVTESITIEGVAAGGPVRHLLATFPDVRISDLRVVVGGTPVPTSVSTGDSAETITFAAPHAGPLSYDVAYTVSQQGAEQVPLLVPAVPSDGTRVVRLTYHVPDGYHVQGEPFPVVIGTSGTQHRDLVGLPSFLAYQLGREPSSGFGFYSWLGVLIIVLGVALSAVVMLREARAKKR